MHRFYRLHCVVLSARSTHESVWCNAQYILDQTIEDELQLAIVLDARQQANQQLEFARLNK
jgi:hypothetical protein